VTDVAFFKTWQLPVYTKIFTGSKDYNRVKLLYQDNKHPEYIKAATAMPIHVINQYIDIINQYVKEQNAS
jgi:hypothetical protein